MLGERYRPETWDDFIGQPAIDEIREACTDPWLFDGCGERWLFESEESRDVARRRQHMSPLASLDVQTSLSSGSILNV